MSLPHRHRPGLRLPRHRGTTVDTILADIIGLDLADVFDAVVLWSRLINASDTIMRQEFMATCRRHVSPAGVVLVWRFQPGWVRTVEASRNDHGDGMISELHSVRHDGSRLRATVAWESDGERYQQPFEAIDLDDDAIEQLASAHGLAVAVLLDPDQMLVRLEEAR